MGGAKGRSRGRSSSGAKARTAKGEESSSVATRPPPDAPSRHPFLCAADAIVGALVLVAIWVALPARWWPVDVFGTLGGAALFVSAAGLGLGTAWGRRVGLVVAAIVLALGAALTTALAVTAGHLVGLYGPVGGGGALILGTVALLVCPYLVFLPASQVYFLARRGPPEAP
jgi:hypothetical protein